MQAGKMAVIVVAVALSLTVGDMYAEDTISTWNGTTGNWTDFARWSSDPLYPDNGNAGCTYDAEIDAGAVTLDQDIVVERLMLGGGALQGTGGLTLNEGGDWTGGAMNGGGTTAIAAGGVLEIGDPSYTKHLDGRTISNAGTINWTGGMIVSRGTAPTIENLPGALFDVQDGLAMVRNSSSNPCGTFDNLGTFRHSAPTGDTTIRWPFNNTGTVEVQSHTLSLSGGGTSTGTFDISDGATLAVNTPGEWTLTGQVVLHGGVLTGSAVEVSGTVRGYGYIQTDDYANNGALIAEGGTLVLDTTASPDLDGYPSPEAGVVRALTGDIYVPYAFSGLYGFDTELSVGAGHEFRMDYRGLINQGQIDLQGGRYLAPEFYQQGSLTVGGSSASTLQSDSVFAGDGTTSLDADLRIVGSAQFEMGATVTGPAALIVSPGSTVSGQANVGVDVDNQGSFMPGLPTGIFGIDGQYHQAAGATLVIEIGGTVVGTGHDQVAVTGQAELHGTLDLSLPGPYVPAYWDEFLVLPAGAIIDHFDQVKGTYSVGPDKALAAIYGAADVAVVTALAGDANLTGKVDAGDLAILAGHWQDAGTVWEDADFNQDGVINVGDLAILAGHWQDDVGPRPGGAGVPEPAALSLLAVGACLTLLRRRRRDAGR